MLDLSPAITEFLTSRGPREAHLLVWIEARNRETSATETIGFWTGKDHEEFTIGGETRTYYGAGTLLKMTPLVVEAGLSVRTGRLEFSKVAPEVQLAMRGYEVKDAPVQIHVAYYNALTHEPIDEPVRRFKGRVAGLKITRAKKKPGQQSAGPALMELSVLSNAVDLTKTLALKKSDAALRARSPNDGFRKYADLSGTIETIWGEMRAKAPEAAAQGNKDVAPLRENTDR